VITNDVFNQPQFKNKYEKVTQGSLRKQFDEMVNEVNTYFKSGNLSKESGDLSKLHQNVKEYTERVEREKAEEDLKKRASADKAEALDKGESAVLNIEGREKLIESRKAKRNFKELGESTPALEPKRSSEVLLENWLVEKISKSTPSPFNSVITPTTKSDYDFVNWICAKGTAKEVLTDIDGDDIEELDAHQL
jgi:hypothetical protein